MATTAIVTGAGRSWVVVVVVVGTVVMEVVVEGPGKVRAVGSEVGATGSTRWGTGDNTNRCSLRAITDTVDAVLTMIELALPRALSISQPVAPNSGAPSAKAIAVARVSGDFTVRRYDAICPKRWQSLRSRSA